MDAIAENSCKALFFLLCSVLLQILKSITKKLWNGFAIDIFVIVGDIVEGMESSYTWVNTPNIQYRKEVYSVAARGTKPPGKKRKSSWKMTVMVLTPFVSYAYIG